MLLLSILLFAGSMQAATLPPLGTAINYGGLAHSTVTNTGATIVAGDLGPYPGTSVIGFPPGFVTGTMDIADAAANTALGDAGAAYTDAAGETPCTNLTSLDLGSVSTWSTPLAPGVYCFPATSAQLTGTLYLDFSNPSSVFIFQIGTTLTTASSSSVVAVGTPSSCNNVIWQVGFRCVLGRLP